MRIQIKIILKFFFTTGGFISCCSTTPMRIDAAADKGHCRKTPLRIDRGLGGYRQNKDKDGLGEVVCFASCRAVGVRFLGWLESLVGLGGESRYDELNICSGVARNHDQQHQGRF